MSERMNRQVRCCGAVWGLAQLWLLVMAAPASVIFDPEAGLPLMRHFRPVDYGGHPQVHAVAAGPSGELLLANAGALLAYDGTRWAQHPAPVTSLFELSAGVDGRMYTSGDGSFGYFELSAEGEWRYASLLERMPEAAGPLRRVILQFQVGDTLFFANRQRAFKWDGERIEVLREWGEAPRFYRLEDSLYVMIADRGLCRWHNGQLQTIVGAEPFLQPRTFAPARLPDGRLLLFMGADGTWAIDERTGAVEAYATPADAILAEARFEDCLQLPGIGWAITTFGKGVILLSEDARTMRILDRSSGLPDNVAFDLHLDREGGLWIAFNTGLSRVQVYGRSSVFDARNGPPPGTVDSWGRMGSQLFVGCFDGLYALQPADPQTGSSAAFQHLDLGVRNVFFIEEHAGELLFTGRTHLYRFEPATADAAARAVPLVDLGGSLPFKSAFSRLHRDLLYLPTLNGFAVIGKRDGQWQLLLNNTELGYTRRVVENPDGSLWLSSYTIGFVRVEPHPSGDWSKATFTTYKDGHGLPDAVVWTEVYEDAHGPYFFTDKGSRRWDAEAARFVEDPHYRDAVGRAVSVKPLVQASDLAVWGSRYIDTVRAAETAFGFYASADGGASRWQAAAPADLLEIGFAGIAEMHLEPAPAPPIIWARGYHNMLRIALDAPAAPSIPWRARIQRLSANGSTRAVSHETQTHAFPFSREPLTFELAAPQFSRGTAVRFQHRLLGFNARWSAPSETPSAHFTNLSGGPFTFEARAIDLAGAMSEPARLQFRVSPPWHRSPLAYGLYGLAALGTTLGFLRWRLRAATREQQRLSSLVRERTRELEAASIQARAANEAKSRFLANMSHELRTPLNGILGYAQLLRRNADLPPQVNERLLVIEDSGAHLLAMINEILDISKIEARRMQRVDAPFPLRQLLDQLAAATELRAAAKGLAFEAIFANAVPECVRGDGRKLRQILENLLNNATKFTLSGKVTLHVAYSANALECVVSDSGPGIPQSEHAKIFEPFTQVAANTPSPGEQSTGLGLPIAKAYAELLGGSLELASEPGNGATFTLRLPIQPADPADALTSSANCRFSGFNGPTKHLLIVDDLPLNRSILCEMLEPLGFVTTQASDLQSTLQCLQSQTFDCLLLDLRLPDANALDHVPAIKAQFPQLPILAISASVLELPTSAILSVGCDGFLPKPFKFEDLLQQLGTILQLEWRTSASPPTAQSPSQPALTGASDARLAKEHLEALLAMARSGDVVALRQFLQSLAASDAAAAQLLATLNPLLSRYQMADIRRILRQSAADSPT